MIQISVWLSPQLIESKYFKLCILTLHKNVTLFWISAIFNCKKRNNDPTGHAEIVAIRQASQKLQSCYLEKCVLYVTLEPCIMCTGAIIHSRIGLLVYGIDDPKTGAIRTVLNLPDSNASNHRLPVISGILKQDCQQHLQEWFKKIRDKKIIYIK